MSQVANKVSNETLKFEEIHKGKLVKDRDGDVGKVVCSSDIHNIKVKLSDGIAYYCLVEDCDAYEPLFEV